MKLTRRQEEFVLNLLDLYREQQGPFHYSELAARLGVSRFTAYDMLRLLEEKGLARSSYRLPEDKSGPGRAEIVYEPTGRARRMMAELAGDVGAENWERVKEHVLERLQSGEIRERELAEEMLARVPPDEPEVIRYCVEVMTVIALHLRRSTGRRVLLDHLPHILPAVGPADRPKLSLFGGFALGVLANELPEGQGYGEWEQELLEHVTHYQRLVQDMQPRMCQHLAARLQDVFVALQCA